MVLDLNKYINLNYLTKKYCKDNVIIINKSDKNDKYFLFPVEHIKEVYGNKFLISLHYSGSVMLNFGVASNCRAYRWFDEKTLTRTEEGSEQFEINLENIDSGVMEIFIRSLSKTAKIFCHASLAQEQKISPELVLYDFVSPSHELCSEEALYYRFSEHSEQTDGAYFCYEDKSVRLAAGSAVDLVTYFNAFSSCKWKKYTNVDTISVFVDFEGTAVAQLVQETIYGESILSSWNLNAETRTVLELPAGECLESGIIGLRIYAEKDSTLYGGGYLTHAPQTQRVHLGIGITTYRREKAVISSVARLAKAIAEHPLYHNAIDITVVDNGRTLSADDLPDATLIPNDNLGGSGGFMRNLIHYQDDGDYTHCVFMDDDASCEPGCVFRSVSFLRHAKDSSVTISGAMLIDTEPAIQWEKGARFEASWQSVHREHNLREVDSLVRSELEVDEGKQLYGGWWFFMFPLREAKMSVFPYFVRGDDIEFSYRNNFKIVTMNGVCSLQGFFVLKDCPLTNYLGYRSYILLNMILDNINFCPIVTIIFLWKTFNRYNLSYHYDTANIIVLIIKNFLKGPDFFIDDINTSKIREYIKNKYKIEVLKHIEVNKKDTFFIENINYTFFKKVLIFISLNGHLFPYSLLDKKNYYIDKFNECNIVRICFKRSFTVYDEINRKGYKLTRNCNYFFKNIIIMMYYTFLFLLKYSFVKRKYLSFYKKLKNGIFWRKLYKQNMVNQ